MCVGGTTPFQMGASGFRLDRPDGVPKAQRSRIRGNAQQPTTWYKRLAAIPGVGYPGDESVRKKLPDANATPRVERFDLGDGPHEALRRRGY
jgi:hypothetical protein